MCIQQALVGTRKTSRRAARLEYHRAHCLQRNIKVLLFYGKRGCGHDVVPRFFDSVGHSLRSHAPR